MPKEPDNDTIAADAQPAEPQRTPWPPLPEPFDVPHVTISGGTFGGFEVMRSEYIDRSNPRRGILHRLFHHS